MVVALALVGGSLGLVLFYFPLYLSVLAAIIGVPQLKNCG
jgi:hypothetical protein